MILVLAGYSNEAEAQTSKNFASINYTAYDVDVSVALNIAMYDAQGTRVVLNGPIVTVTAGTTQTLSIPSYPLPFGWTVAERIVVVTLAGFPSVTINDASGAVKFYVGPHKRSFQILYDGNEFISNYIYF